MQPTAILPLNIDSTQLTCFRSCPEKFNLEFIHGLRPAGVSVDLHAGGCFATGIEAVRKAVFQKGKSLQDALLEGYAAYSIAWGSFEIPDHKKTSKTREQTWAAVEEYFAKWPPLTDHFQPYYLNGKPALEFTFAIPLEPAVDPSEFMGIKHYDPDVLANAGAFPLHPSGTPWLYSGRFDMLGEYMGLPAFGDEKTTGRSISSGWSESWTLRNQFIGYTWALRQSGLPAAGGMVRGIAILKTMINFAEAYKPYSNDLIARWYEQLRRDMWRLRQSWDSGYFDLNLADACTSYGQCIFMNICSSSKEMRPNWFNDFEIRRWNPLEKNPISEKVAA